MPRPPLPRPGPAPIPTPAPLPTPEASPMTLSGYRVEGKVEDQAANLTFHITFHNPTNQRLEGVLMIPIPAETVLSGFAMTVGGKEMKGELLEAEKAASIYEGIVRQMRDPGLLELVGERMVRARVFPIEPNGDIIVRMTLTQILRQSGDLYSLNIPLRSSRMVAGTVGRASVSLDLHASRPLRSVYSPDAEARITRTGPQGATLRYEAPAADGADLSLFYSMAASENPLSVGLLPFREEGEDGYFMLSLSPRVRAPEGEVVPKDVVFILDRSGSMEEGGKMAQARAALSYCLKALAPQDRFGIVDFATDAASLDSRLLTATPANRARALRYVERLEASGGTNIEASLDEGMRLINAEPQAGRVPMVFFMTDGLPTVGQTDVQSLLKAAAEKNKSLRSRIFSFGVGSDVNTLLLDKLAEMNRGARDYVAPNENIEAKVSSLYQKIAKPALTDVRIRWEGVEASEVYPRPVTDIFYGSDLTLLGRYPKGGKGRLILTGRAAGKDARFEFPVDMPEMAAQHAFLPRLWANLKVANALDAIRLGGKADPEVVNEIVRLAKKHGIVTPYTSYLITEDGADRARIQNQAFDRVTALREEARVSGFSGGGAGARAAQKSSTFFGAVSALRGSSFGAESGSFDGGAPHAAPAAPMARLMADSERETRDELKAGGKRAVETRTLAGKTFYLRGEAWVDGDYEMADKGSIKELNLGYLSPEYFEVLGREPGLSRYLSLGKRLVILWQGTAYRIQ